MVNPEPKTSTPIARTEPNLTEVFRQEYEPLMRLAYVLTGDQHESEELVQDAFMELQSRWDHVLNPAGYLRTVVANGAKRKGRQRTNRRRIIEENKNFMNSKLTNQQPYEHYLTDSLSRLPYRNRVAIVLAYFGGFTSPEIAQLLKCRPGTARSLVHRGLHLLEKELSRE